MTSLILPNRDLIVLASGVQASSFNSADFNNRYFKGIRLLIDITAISGVGATLTAAIQLKDPVTANYVSYGNSGGLTTVTSKGLIVTPYTPGSANLFFQRVLTQTWRMAYTIAGTTPSITFSVGGMYIP